MGRLRVIHFLASANASVVPSVGVWNWYNLFGVGYRHTVSAETGYPASPREMSLFTRFLGGQGRVGFEIRVWWLDGPDGRELIEVYGPLAVAFRTGDTVRDAAFRIGHLTLPGAGRYAILLRSLPGRHAKAAKLATDFFEVVTSP
jgi:hypothetical protein